MLHVSGAGDGEAAGVGRGAAVCATAGEDKYNDRALHYMALGSSADDEKLP